MSELVYGRRPVAEAHAGRRSVLRTWESPDTPPEELERLCGSPEHQGIVAEVDDFAYADPASLLEAPDALVLALDQVQDPQNLGAACRVAEVAGAAGLVIPERRSAQVTPAVAKASAGAVEHLPIARVVNLADWLESAKKAESCWVYGAQGGAGRSIYEVDWSGRAVVVMGSEGEGIRTRVASVCDELVSIPMRGEIDSLNVSTAAAVICFEAARQKAASQA